MYTEDNLKPIIPRGDPHHDFRPAQTNNDPVFPAELLDSGFEWTEILTTESGG